MTAPEAMTHLGDVATTYPVGVLVDRVGRPRSGTVGGAGNR